MRPPARRAKRPHDRAITGEGMTDQGAGPDAQRDARRDVPAPTGPTLHRPQPRRTAMTDQASSQ